MWFWLALCTILITTLFAIVTTVFSYIDKTKTHKYLLATLISCTITIFVLIQKPSPQTLEYSLDYHNQVIASPKEPTSPNQKEASAYDSKTHTESESNDKNNSPKETSSGQETTTTKYTNTEVTDNKNKEIQTPKPHQPDSGDTKEKSHINTENTNDSPKINSKTNTNKPDNGLLETIAPLPETGGDDTHSATTKMGKIKDHVNFRDSASIKSKVIKVLPPDITVDLLSPYNADNWVKVRETGKGQEGWVFGKFIKPLD